MGWGNLIGAGLGFVVGGPAGAALGASLGGAAEEATVDDIKSAME